MKKAVFIILCTLLLLFFAAQSDNRQRNREEKSASRQLQELNNSEIKSVSYKNLQIIIRQTIPVKLSGFLCFEGAKLRLSASSFFGKEIDVGMNDRSLWYWSKRLKPKALYYCKISEVNKSGLKSALNPKWILISTCVEQKKPEKYELIELKQGRMLISEHQNHTGAGMHVGRLYDSEQRLKGAYLFSPSGRMVASSEVTSFYFHQSKHLPRSLHVIWYEEGIVMDWHLGSPEVNREMPSQTWSMPNIQPTVNIGK